jgi:hypothetical protein
MKRILVAVVVAMVTMGLTSSNVAEAGMKQVIFLAFAGAKCGSQ